MGLRHGVKTCLPVNNLCLANLHWGARGAGGVRAPFVVRFVFVFKLAWSVACGLVLGRRRQESLIFAN